MSDTKFITIKKEYNFVKFEKTLLFYVCIGFTWYLRNFGVFFGFDRKFYGNLTLS